MFEPDRSGHNTLVALPSGREWIAVGGRGEWDHYGEPSLAPTGPVHDEDKPARKASTTAKQRAHKPATKKPSRAGAKKAATKGATKKR
jgi:hypothetical protein